MKEGNISLPVLKSILDNERNYRASAENLIIDIVLANFYKVDVEKIAKEVETKANKQQLKEIGRTGIKVAIQKAITTINSFLPPQNRIGYKPKRNTENKVLNILESKTKRNRVSKKDIVEAVIEAIAKANTSQIIKPEKEKCYDIIVNSLSLLQYNFGDTILKTKFYDLIETVYELTEYEEIDFWLEEWEIIQNDKNNCKKYVLVKK